MGRTAGGALPSEPAVFATKEALRRFLGRTGLEGLVFAEPVDFSREQAVYAALRSAQSLRGAPGGSALLYSGGAGHRLGDGARRFGLSHNGAGGGSGDGSISPRRAEE